MERKETIVQNVGFIKHVFNFDEDTKIDLLKYHPICLLES